VGNSSIVKINQPLSNGDNFDTNMNNLGYQMVGKVFLVKNINGIDINITKRNNTVESITGYKNDDVIDIPQDILQQVQNDISSAL
jgi:hypothetical protein